MQNRTTFMERINERVCVVEDILKKMEPVEDLLERLSMLENNIYTTKKVLTFSEACVYMGVSESLLYKLTAAQEVPHYKPRGKMLYFNKEELDQWLLQNNIPTIGAVTKVETDEREDKNEVKPYFGQKRYGRKTKAMLDKQNGNNKDRISRILSESLIKATDTYQTPPQIIWVDNSTIATLGNFSASTGKAKAKKTFNVSALVAASLANGKVLNYRASLPEGKRKILYVDTEQSRYHCHNVLERILKLAGLPTSIDNENLDFICLREYTPSVRIEVIDYALAQDQSYGLVIIDGIRDLLLDINNAGESVEVINKMMEWSSKYDLHIHCVLHQNKGDNNVRGHIGTEMNNKAETVLVITKSTTNPDISEVKAMHIREKEFKPFAFTVNDEGLPEIVEHTPEKEEGDKQPSRFTYQDLTPEQHNEALTAAFKEKPIKGFDRMVEELTQAYADIGFKRGRSVIIKMLKYLMNEQKLIVKRDNHYYFGYTPAEIDLFHEEE